MGVPTKEGMKEGYPLKRYFAIIHSSSVKMVADRHIHQWRFSSGPGGNRPHFYFSPPVSWPSVIYCRDNKMCDFFAFPNLRKRRQICGLHWTSKNPRCFSFRGLCPLTSWPGALPLDLNRAIPSDPRYRLALPPSPWSRCPFTRYFKFYFILIFIVFWIFLSEFWPNFILFFNHILNSISC